MSVTPFLDLLRKVGGYQRQKQRGLIAAEVKADGSLVTKVDRESERMLIAGIREIFGSQCEILGEETASETSIPPQTGFSIDPLDGTWLYKHGFMEFGISVAYLEDGHPVMGAIYNPLTDFYVEAKEGQGCWLNGKRVELHWDNPSMSDPMNLEVSNLNHTSEEFRQKVQLPLERVLAYKRHFCSTYGILELLEGLTMATIMPRPYHWDIAFGWLAVQEAGGTCNTLLPFSTAFQSEQLIWPATMLCAGENVRQLLLSHMKP